MQLSQEEMAIVAAFRSLKPKTKRTVSIFILGQAVKQVASKPQLQLIINNCIITRCPVRIAGKV